MSREDSGQVVFFEKRRLCLCGSEPTEPTCLLCRFFIRLQSAAPIARRGSALSPWLEAKPGQREQAESRRYPPAESQ